jgi:hypothetical protein
LTSNIYNRYSAGVGGEGDEKGHFSRLIIWRRLLPFLVSSKLVALLIVLFCCELNQWQSAVPERRWPSHKVDDARKAIFVVWLKLG